jgi:hypothetical protein
MITLKKNMRPLSLKSTIDLLVYLSVALGILLLIQLYWLVPAWLFYSVLGGWIAYLAITLTIVTHHDAAYPAVLILAMVTLLVSLPQPEHYEFVQSGQWLPSLTFVAGSAIQTALLVLVPLYLLKKRKTN